MWKLISLKNRQFVEVGYDMISKINFKCNVRHCQNQVCQVQISSAVCDCHSDCRVYKSLREREDKAPRRWRGSYGRRPLYELDTASESESYISDEGYETEDRRKVNPKTVNEIVDKVLKRVKEHISKTGKWQLKIPEYQKTASSGALYISSGTVKDFRSVKRIGSFKMGNWNRRNQTDEFSGTVEIPELTVQVPKYRFTVWGTTIVGSMQCRIRKCQIRLNVTALEYPKTDLGYRIMGAKSNVKFQYWMNCLCLCKFKMKIRNFRDITVYANGLTMLFNWILSAYLTKVVREYSYSTLISNQIGKATTSVLQHIGK